MLYDSSFAFSMAVYSAGGTTSRFSRRLGRSFNEDNNGSNSSPSLVTWKENIDDAKPEPYENIPILLPTKSCAFLLCMKKRTIRKRPFDSRDTSYLTSRDARPPYKEAVYMLPTRLANVKEGWVRDSNRALLQLTAACSSSR